ncbi:MAG TPA: hypothetical protein VHG72_10255 [Polyangia bacterium]|nr:hypothetical protein [Polyangia bacterium]
MSSTQVRPDSRPTDRRFVGRWRIVEMEAWDADFVDSDVPGHFTFTGDQGGEFQFGTVRGWMDCRYDSENARAEFSWEGADDADEACGRGWAEIAGDSLRGRIFIHRGDDSGFEARKEADTATNPRSRHRPRRVR